MTQLLLFSVESAGNRVRSVARAARKAVTQVAKWVQSVIPFPNPAPKKARHMTAQMILDVFDVSFWLWRSGGRLLPKATYCDRWCRGSLDSRGRRWSTFRACLRWLGIEHQTAPDEAGVLIASPLSAYKTAEKALPPVGPVSDREEAQHEAARRDAEVWIGLGVARIHGPMGVSGVEGLVRLAGVLR